MGIFEVICLISLLTDVLLLFAFFYLYRRIRLLSPKKLDLLIENMKETRQLADQLHKLIEEKAKLTSEIKKTLNPDEFKDDSLWQIRKSRSKVLELYSKGLEIDEISRKTGLTQGEIELILSLSKAN